MNKLVVGFETWQRFSDHLLADETEHLCFLLAEHVSLGLENVFLERELHLIDDQDFDCTVGWFGFSLKLETLLRVMNRANELGAVIFEAHSHPFSRGNVQFSTVDLSGQKEMVGHLSDVMPGVPYGALVQGQDAVLGQIWFAGQNEPAQLDEIRVVGPVLQRIEASGRTAPSLTGARSDPDQVHHRQVLAFGRVGQRQMETAKVGIVGLGGIGSMVAQELAYLGVRKFVLVDDDTVEETNLNRLVGVTAENIGEAKVEAAARHLKRIAPATKVEALRLQVRSSEALRALVKVDVMFGCVDTDSGRLILNELANTYMIPYVDCGVGIDVVDGRVVEAGGRVVVWVPGRPCLLCSKDINTRVAAEELESHEQQQFRRERGYVAGATVLEPAVISLNGIIASVATTEFLALVTGFRPSCHYNFYDMLEQRLVPRLVRSASRCPTCALVGTGDKAHVERYARSGLPQDLPQLES